MIKTLNYSFIMIFFVLKLIIFNLQMGETLKINKIILIIKMITL